MSNGIIDNDAIATNMALPLVEVFYDCAKNYGTCFFCQGIVISYQPPEKSQLLVCTTCHRSVPDVTIWELYDSFRIRK